MKNFYRLTVSALTLSVAILSGCAGATRLPLRAKGPAGESLDRKKLDLEFLGAPDTRRDQVVERLGSIDTAYQNPRLFWGRWSDSKWGYWWFVAGGNSAAGDAKRVWHVHNLLVSFDENGTVRKKEVIDNDQALWAELHALLGETAPLDLSQPVPLEVHGLRDLAKITLTKDVVELERHKGKMPVLQISPQKIVRISHSRAYANSHPSSTCHTLHFDEKTAWGKSVLFCASPADVATLFQYLQQAGASNLRWD